MVQELLKRRANKKGDKVDYHILCIDDDPSFLASLKLELDRTYRCSIASDLRSGLSIIQRETVDLVLLDIRLGAEDGIEGLREIKKLDPSVDVVMVTGHKDPKLIISSVKAGASDYICKPFEFEELAVVIEKLRQVRQMRTRHDALIEGMMTADTRSRLLGISRAFLDVLDKAGRVKGHNANILIEGESGTGKELLARYIHSLECNPRRPFIAINCAAIPDALLESELFGHEKGSFTGATYRKIGKFELANGGDIFLDEISALKPELQAKILRVLQEKEISRIGSVVPVSVNFRVIAATNDDMDALVRDGRFRTDLFHRLCVIRLRMPPLRERKEDIPLLVDHFLKKYSRPPHNKTVSPSAMKALMRYNWPGNIRELENLIHNLVIMAPNGSIEVGDLPSWIVYRIESEATLREGDKTLSLEEHIARVERMHIQRALEASEGNRSKAAKLLNMSRTTLYWKLKQLGLE